MSEINVKYEGRDVWCIEYDVLECIQEDFEFIMEDLIQLKSKVQRFQSLYVAARERGRSLQKNLVILTPEFREKGFPDDFVVDVYEKALADGDDHEASE